VDGRKEAYSHHLAAVSIYANNSLLYYEQMRYETEKKIIAGMNKLFNEESEDILQKNKALQEEVSPLKKEIEQLKKSLK